MKYLWIVYAQIVAVFYGVAITTWADKAGGAIRCRLGAAMFRTHTEGGEVLVYLMVGNDEVCLRVARVLDSPGIVLIHLRQLFRALSFPETKLAVKNVTIALVAGRSGRDSELLRLTAPNGYSVLLNRDGWVWNTDLSLLIDKILAVPHGAFNHPDEAVTWLEWRTDTQVWFFNRAYNVEAKLSLEEERHFGGVLSSTLVNLDFCAHQSVEGDWRIHAIDEDNQAVCFRADDAGLDPADLVTLYLPEITFALLYGSKVVHVRGLTVELLPNITGQCEMMRIVSPSTCAVILVQADGSVWDFKMTKRVAKAGPISAEAFDSADAAAAWVARNTNLVRRLIIQDSVPQGVLCGVGVYREVLDQ